MIYAKKNIIIKKYIKYCNLKKENYGLYFKFTTAKFIIAYL